MQQRDDKDSKNLKRIKTSTELMLSLISDIIDSAKLNEGQLQLVEETFILEDLFNEVEDLFEL